MIKRLEVVTFWYDNDYHVGSGKTFKECFESIYESLVENGIVDDDDWKNDGYADKEAYIRDIENGSVMPYTVILTQSLFDRLNEFTVKA